MEFSACNLVRACRCAASMPSAMTAPSMPHNLRRLRSWQRTLACVDQHNAHDVCSSYRCLLLHSPLVTACLNRASCVCCRVQTAGTLCSGRTMLAATCHARYCWIWSQGKVALTVQKAGDRLLVTQVQWLSSCPIWKGICTLQGNQWHSRKRPTGPVQPRVDLPVGPWRRRRQQLGERV